MKRLVQFQTSTSPTGQGLGLHCPLCPRSTWHGAWQGTALAKGLLSEA